MAVSMGEVVLPLILSVLIVPMPPRQQQRQTKRLCGAPHWRFSCPPRTLRKTLFCPP